MLGAAVLAAAAPSATAATLPTLRADRACPWGAASCSPAGRGVLGQFGVLRDHGDVLGFRMGGAPDVTMDHHWQGVQRLMTPGRGRYLVVTRSGAHVSFVVVRMASRTASGERFGSNRIPPSVAPPAGDRVVKVVRSDAGFDHSGGIQTAGRYLAVGLEAGSRSRVAFWDLKNPLRPVRVGTLAHATGLTGAGTVSLARLAGGRYLLIVGGTDADNLDFYVSRAGSRLSKPAFDFVVRWNERQLRTELGSDREFGAYQNLALVGDSGGALFLLGTHENDSGEDWADLFRLENDAAAGVRITKVAKRHLFCSIPSLGRQCNLDAAGGVYVSPARRLLLYATEHDNDGPGGSVKAEEFGSAASARG